MARPASKVSSWVGVLAQLRRVDVQHAGRLVLVERPAPAQSGEPTGREPVPAWHVFVLGARLSLQGDTWREAEVLETCLQPLCRLPAVIAEVAIEGQAQQDFDEAMNELRDHLHRHPMAHAQLDASLEQAALQASGPRVWPLVPVRRQ
jgi:hypothetical protein